MADELLADAQTPRAFNCWAQTGCSAKVSKALPERALNEEQTAHLAYEKHDPADRG